MTLSNNLEILLVGGNKELVIYNWEEGELVQFHSEPYRNIIEIAVCDNWFVIKYKRKKAKLFRILPDDEDIELDLSWDLKLKPFKSEFRTLQINRFRKNQLIIFDASHKSAGYDIQLEVFDVKKKTSVILEDYKFDEKKKITAIAYSSRLKNLVIFDEAKYFKIFEFDMEGKVPEKSGMKLKSRRLFDCKGTLCRVIMNRLFDYYLVGTTAGEVFIINGKTLIRESKLNSHREVVDIMISDQRRNAFIYVMHSETKDFMRFMLHNILGNLILDRDGFLYPEYSRGIVLFICIQIIIFRGAKNEEYAERSGQEYQDNPEEYKVVVIRDLKRKIREEIDIIEELKEKIQDYRRENATDEGVRELEQNRIDLEKVYGTLEVEENKRQQKYKEEKESWQNKINKLKMIKDEIENSQPQKNPEIKKKLKKKTKTILKLIKKGRNAEDIKTKKKKMKKIKDILDEILVRNPKSEDEERI